MKKKHGLAVKSMALLLLLLLLFPTAVSCSDTGPDTEVPGENTIESTDPGNSDNTTPVATVTTDGLDDNLPDVSFDGYNFRILTDSTIKKYLFIESDGLGGDAVDEAVYLTNMEIENRFGVELSTVEVSDVSEVDVLMPYLATNDDLFDIGMLHDCTAGALSVKGYFRNVYDFDAFDFSKPWWPKFTVDTLTFSDRMYFISNFISYYGMESTRLTWVNLGMMEEYGYGSPYSMVADRTWTLDNVLAMVENVYSDDDSNNVKSIGDTFGYHIGGNWYCWLEAFGIEMAQKGSDGATITFNDSDSRLFTLADKLGSFFGDDKKGTYWQDSQSDSLDAFAQGKSLMSYQKIGNMLPRVIDTDLKRGTLPMPLLDEKQEDYYGACTDWPVVIPVTAKDDDRLGIIVEAMSAEGYKRIRPAYYDLALKSKYSYDPESAQMLDIIFGNRVLSFTYMYREYGGMTQMELPLTIAQGDGNISTYLQRMKAYSNVYFKKLAKFYETGEVQ